MHRHVIDQGIESQPGWGRFSGMPETCKAGPPSWLENGDEGLPEEFAARSERLILAFMEQDCGKLVEAMVADVEALDFRVTLARGYPFDSSAPLMPRAGRVKSVCYHEGGTLGGLLAKMMPPKALHGALPEWKRRGSPDLEGMSREALAADDMLKLLVLAAHGADQRELFCGSKPTAWAKVIPGLGGLADKFMRIQNVSLAEVRLESCKNRPLDLLRFYAQRMGAQEVLRLGQWGLKLDDLGAEAVEEIYAAVADGNIGQVRLLELLDPALLDPAEAWLEKFAVAIDGRANYENCIEGYRQEVFEIFSRRLGAELDRCALPAAELPGKRLKGQL